MADRATDLAALGRRTELVACHFPVRVTIIGRLGDDRLALLADRVEAAVAARLTEAARTVPASVAVLHQPQAVAFSGEVADPDRSRLEQALRAAVARAAGRLPAPATPVPGSAHPVHSGLSRLRTRPSGPPRPPGTRRAAAPTPAAPDRYPPPPVDPAGDVRHGGPLHGAVVGRRVDGGLLALDSTRYAVAGSLTVALQLGAVLFPATSFAVLEDGDGIFWSVATSPGVDSAQLSPLGPVSRGSLLDAVEAAGHGYQVLGLVTSDNRPVWTDYGTGVEWLRRLAADAARGIPPLLPDLAAATITAAADQLNSAAAPTAAPARRPAGGPTPLDPPQFARAPWLTKVDYLRALLAATPWTDQPRTALSILAAVRVDDEVDAVVAVLRESGLGARLFDDPSPEVFDLFASIGERFPRDPGPLTLRAVAHLLAGFDPLARPGALAGPGEAGRRAGPTTVPTDAPATGEQMLDQAREAVAGFVDAGRRLGESVEALLGSPRAVARAKESLARFVVLVQVAELGDRTAQWRLNRFLQRVPSATTAPVRGAERLGAGDRTLSRLRWREIWQLAVRFDNRTAGPELAGGELTGDAFGALLLLARLARLGVPAEVSTRSVSPAMLATQLVALAVALAAARPELGSADEVTALLARLPDERLRPLGALMVSTSIAPGMSLDQLAAASPELHRLALDAIPALIALAAPTSAEPCEQDGDG
jgi:hypothetical protein